MYYFSVDAKGHTELVYPSGDTFSGPVPHEDNSLKPDGKGGYVLSPVVGEPISGDDEKADGKSKGKFKRAIGALATLGKKIIGKDSEPAPKFRKVNLFASLAKQTGLESLSKLAQTGMTYRKNAAGELVPDFSDPAFAKDRAQLETWFPKLVKSSPAEAAKAEKDGAAFKNQVSRVQQLSFPDGTKPCPTGLKQLLDFPQDAFDQLKAVTKFKPNAGNDDWATIVAGSPQDQLAMAPSLAERAVAFNFYDAKSKQYLPPLKLYQDGDTAGAWVIPNGQKDPVSQALLCERVNMLPALPDVRDDAASLKKTDHAPAN
jgi:hypothetical protein